MKVGLAVAVVDIQVVADIQVSSLKLERDSEWGRWHWEVRRYSLGRRHKFTQKFSSVLAGAGLLGGVLLEDLIEDRIGDLQHYFNALPFYSLSVQTTVTMQVSMQVPVSMEEIISMEEMISMVAFFRYFQSMRNLLFPLDVFLSHFAVTSMYVFWTCVQEYDFSKSSTYYVLLLCYYEFRVAF